MKIIKVFNPRFLPLLTSFLLLIPGIASAGHADMNDKARSGTVVCGGNQLYRLPGSDARAMEGTEAHLARYVLRNYGDVNINIDRMRLFNAQGSVLFDTDLSGLPAFNNDVLGPDNIIEPNQTAQLSLESILGDISMPVNLRPLQLRIDWSAGERALKPDIVLVRIVRDRVNFGTPEFPDFRIRGERSRHLYECRHITR